MSGYFDGLMRSSGLPLGHAPVIGSSARPTAPLSETDTSVPAAGPSTGPHDVPLTETDIAAPMARPVISPLDVTARSVQRAMAAVPVRAEAATTPWPPGIAQSIPAGQPSPTAPAPEAPPAPQPWRQDQSPTPASQPVTAPPSLEPSAEQAISRERIIQAAMRWVAAGPVPSPAPSAPPPDVEAAAQPAKQSDQPPSRGFATMQATAHRSPTEAAPVEQPAEVQSPVPPRPSAAEPIQQLHAAAFPLQPVAPPLPPEESVQVSIGEIHLRVEAPGLPAMQAARAPMQRPPTSTQAAPRSGLSRRALRRI